MNFVEKYRNKNLVAQFEQTKELYAKLKDNVSKQREYKDWLVDVAYGKLHHDCKGVSCETCAEAFIGLDILAKEKWDKSSFPESADEMTTKQSLQADYDQENYQDYITDR